MDISPIFLPHFRLYEVASLNMCVLPFKYRKILEMLLKLLEVSYANECGMNECGAGSAFIRITYLWSRQRMRKRTLDALGGIIAIDRNLYSLYKRIELVFFMNRYHEERKLHEISQVGSGDSQFAEYTVSTKTAAWPTRECLINYQHALEWHAKLEGLEASRDGAREVARFYEATRAEWDSKLLDDASLKGMLFEEYSVNWVATRAKFLAVKAHQTLKQYTDASTLLKELLGQPCAAHRHGRWWDRLALIEEHHLRKPIEALQFCKLAFADTNVCTGHLLDIIDRARRICASHKYQTEHPELKASRPQNFT